MSHLDDIVAERAKWKDSCQYEIWLKDDIDYLLGIALAQPKEHIEELDPHFIGISKLILHLKELHNGQETQTPATG
jgi:hypothetical protein